MSAELGDWLAELCAAEPASAAEVGAALVAVMDSADPSALPAAGEAAAAPVQAPSTQAEETPRGLDDSQRPDAATEASRPQESAGAPAGLLELRADPLGRDVRLLLAVEPAGTITLLAVLDGADAVAEYRTQAIELAGDLLADVRGGYWPPEEARRAADRAVMFADPASFLARFFPADSGVIRERAAGVATARSLD